MADFDIITGNPRRKYMSESRATLPKSVEKFDVFNQIKGRDDNRFPILRLGIAKDHKKDFYTQSSAN